MAAIDWDFLVAWLLAPAFGLLTILYLYQRDLRRLTWVNLPRLAYLILGLLWGLGVLFAHPRIRDLPPFVPFERLAPYLLAASPAFLLLATTDLVHTGRPRWRWLLIAPALLIIFAVFHDGTLHPNLAQTLVLGVRRFDRDGLWRLILLTANLISVIAAFRLSSELYREGRGLLYRNRLRYWFLVLALVALGDLLTILFSHPSLLFYLGGLVRLGGVTMATATLLIPYLPTTNYVIRLLLNILTMGLLTFGLFLTTMLTALAVLPHNEQAAAMAGATVVAAIVALIYTPLQRGVRSMIDRLLLRHKADLSNVLTEYNRQIGQQSDLEQLAETAMTLLGEALHLEPGNNEGALIIATVTDEGAAWLTPIARPGRPSLPDLLCSSSSPLSTYWRKIRHPLSQYDVEVLPDFAAVSDAERDSLAQWGTELYVPLHSPEHLVGVLALGPKRSGAAYNPAEIRFLRALTSQIAADLEQAQLLSDLKTTNAQLTRLSDKLARVNQRLYEADRLKSGFIGVITHELRSPFVSLALSLQLIERYGLERLLPEQREQLDELRKGITELKQILDHIISFASLLSKQGELKLEQLDLGQVVTETVEAMKPMAEIRQVTLEARVWPGLSPIQGDRARLSEAIYHLTHNAIKFNHPGGWVRVRCQPENGNIEVRVQDNGIGVPSDRLEHLWSEFVQMADPLRRGVEGLGLGLALVRYVAIAHGGEVWAESTEGQGSTFGFKVPAMQTRAECRLSVPKSSP